MASVGTRLANDEAKERRVDADAELEHRAWIVSIAALKLNTSDAAASVRASDSGMAGTAAGKLSPPLSPIPTPLPLALTQVNHYNLGDWRGYN